MTQPTRRHTLVLDLEADQRLREAAAERGTRPGILARALVALGVDALEKGDVATEGAVAAAVQSERARRAEIGRAAMASRWGHEERLQEGQDGAAGQGDEMGGVSR
ncbi:hypothetical protein [Brachybacterium sp. sponge]|uniref:hypothetical protein n=1 Tax=Brachybacterium sp. sponge TaxID=1775432 RepID=UPI0007A4E32C|nr:hypothetical protein [Brachybacterium sp. sponge]